MINVAVIGYGYWGPNIARNFNSCDGFRLKVICDGEAERLKKASATFPHVEVTSDTKELCKRTDIDVVCIITPVFTHFDLTRAALENGKHVFVEKPFTTTADQALPR